MERKRGYIGGTDQGKRRGRKPIREERRGAKVQKRTRGSSS